MCVCVCVCVCVRVRERERERERDVPLVDESKIFLVTILRNEDMQEKRYRKAAGKKAKRDKSPSKGLHTADSNRPK